MEAQEKVRILGVDCPTCVLSIERELSKLGAGLEVDLSSGLAAVKYNPSRASMRDVVRAIRSAGYDVEKQSTVLLVELSEEEVPRFERSVSELRGVIECHYSPLTGLAKVVYNPYAIAESELLEAIRKLGWAVEPAAEGRERIERGAERPWIPLLSFAAGLLAVGYYALEAFGLTPSAGAAFYASLATVVLALNAGLIWRGLRALARLSPTMDSLIALSSIIPYASSLAFATAGLESTFFEATAGVLGFVAAGKYLEERLRARALEALGELAALRSGRARVVREGGSVEVGIDQLKVGDVVEVRAGERVPVDGVTVEGWGYVDESAFTGEPLPRFKTAERRDPVLAGTLLVKGFLRVSATRVGRDTSLAYIVETVRESQFRKPGFQRVADRIVGYLTWLIIALSAATPLYWVSVGADPARAVVHAAAVLAVACPCPLGIAVPLVAAIASIKAARYGILVRGGDVFERILRVDAAIFDKTGTLTAGSPRVHGVHTFNGFSEEQLLRLAGSAESRSEHPLARAVLERCEMKGVKLSEPSSYEHVPGMGVIAEVDGAVVAVGSQKLMEGVGVQLPPEAARVAEMLQETGATVLFTAVDGQLAGLLEVRDEIRESAWEVVAQLKGEGVRTVLATGDSEGAGRWVARELGLDEVRCELGPEDKAMLVDELQRSGSRVLFVGDGVNDAPALSRAFLGVAVGGGADIAGEAGDVVLVGGELRALINLRELGRVVRRKALMSLAWAFVYNASLVPVAMGLLYRPLGLVLRPELAAAAMILSDISVVLNALSLLRWRPHPRLSDRGLPR